MIARFTTAVLMTIVYSGLAIAQQGPPDEVEVCWTTDDTEDCLIMPWVATVKCGSHGECTATPAGTLKCSVAIEHLDLQTTAKKAVEAEQGLDDWDFLNRRKCTLAYACTGCAGANAMAGDACWTGARSAGDDITRSQTHALGEACESSSQ